MTQEEHSQEWLDDLEFMKLIESSTSKDKLIEMYHRALMIVAEDNEITIEQVHTGVQLMDLNSDLALLPDESERLH